MSIESLRMELIEALDKLTEEQLRGYVWHEGHI